MEPLHSAWSVHTPFRSVLRLLESVNSARKVKTEPNLPFKMQYSKIAHLYNSFKSSPTALLLHVSRRELKTWNVLNVFRVDECRQNCLYMRRKYVYDYSGIDIIFREFSYQFGGIFSRFFFVPSTFCVRRSSLALFFLTFTLFSPLPTLSSR